MGLGPRLPRRARARRRRAPGTIASQPINGGGLRTFSADARCRVPLAEADIQNTVKTVFMLHHRMTAVSIRHEQAFFSVQKRSALTSALAVSMSFRMMATIATFAGFPAPRSWSYLALRSGLKRMATKAGM